MYTVFKKCDHVVRKPGIYTLDLEPTYGSRYNGTGVSPANTDAFGM